jgi:thymidylate kinase
MARIIAFAGASRVGKTTLMDAVVARLNQQGHEKGQHASEFPLTYHSELGSWLREMGVDAAHNISLDDRLRVQEGLADRYINKVQMFLDMPGSKTVFMDRSWADLCAYTLADVPRDITPAQDEQVQRILTKLQALRPHQAVIVVEPGIPLAAAAKGKAKASHSFQQHINHLIRSQLMPTEVIMHCQGVETAVSTLSPWLFIHPQTTDLDARVSEVMSHGSYLYSSDKEV